MLYGEDRVKTVGSGAAERAFSPSPSSQVGKRGRGQRSSKKTPRSK